MTKTRQRYYVDINEFYYLAKIELTKTFYKVEIMEEQFYYLTKIELTKTSKFLITEDLSVSINTDIFFIPPRFIFSQPSSLSVKKTPPLLI